MLQIISYITLSQVYKSHKTGLFLIFTILSVATMANSKSQNILTDTTKPQILTVANIVKPPGNKEFYEITFYQSARFYKLMRTNKNCSNALLLLKQSKKANKPVQVIFSEKFGDVIENVKKK